jgi:S-adenosylmethionine:tRNA ribosyltransferase-isomerase
LKTSDYSYELPAERIAFYPLPTRDTSKLLVYKGGHITHSAFGSLADHLPEDAFLFLNNTRVIPARLHFHKSTGGMIEIFLLEPMEPSAVPAETMASSTGCTWKCAIGNLKRWRPGTTLQLTIGDAVLDATLVDKAGGIVQFTWTGTDTFAEILHKVGEMPLPPYIKRKANDTDRERYQTVYSHDEGAVAAPTAGLHFTDAVFNALRQKNIGHDFLTLHVSAGTFLPVKTDNPDEHRMHQEQVIVTRSNIQNLITRQGMITAVGTTSMRTLESIYWYGAKLLQNPDSEFTIGQSDATTVPAPITAEALAAVARHMDKNGLATLVGHTSIFIRPGYDFKVCKALITNFHQPASTLIMLVAAFVGDDWRKIYAEALTHDYRFLSYGDSSLLLPDS